MAGLAQSRPQNPQANNKHSLVLNKGKKVEVSSDEDGFKGAWYLATIVDTPPKSGSKKRKKVMVEYKTLLKEDFSPLVEPVDPEHIRPLPPEVSDRVFQENDVVDAGYRDGWWTGVVRKVLEGSRYRVYFSNPPDVLDFDGKDLRPHWEWVNGNWVSSEKQQTTGSIFSSGTGVEVNIENVRDAWFPAVVIKENEDGTFLVKCQNPSNSDVAGAKVSVDNNHIRPIPPRYADRDYELLEKVDTQYCSGWRAGLITKLLAGRRYNVFFKQGNEQKELNHSEIRPNVEWVNGEWICKSQEVLIASNNEKQLDAARNSAGQPEMSLKLETDGAANGKTEQKAPCSRSTAIKTLLEQSTHCNEKSSSHVLPLSKKVKLATPNSTGGRSRTSKKSAEEGHLDGEVSVTPLPLTKMQVETPIEETLGSSRTSKKSAEEGHLDGEVSVTPLPLTKMPVETPIEETLRGMTIPRTYGKRSKCKKPMGNDQVAAQTESPIGVQRTVASGADEILIRIKELPEAEKNKQHEALAVHRRKLEIVTKKGRTSRSPLSFANATTRINETEDNSKEAEVPLVTALEARNGNLPSDQKLKRTHTKNLNDLVGGKMAEGLDQPTSGGSSQRRKRGRPCKLVLKKAPETAKEDVGIKDAANGSGTGDQTINQVELPAQKMVKCTGSQVALKERATEVSEIDCRTKETEITDPIVSNNVVGDDQPLSTWVGGIHSSANAEDLLSSARPEKRRRDLDPELVPCVNGASVNGTPDGNHCLPFVKSSLVWKAIESMEVFRTVPQNPHFRPLADCKEEYREGSAIGVTVTFASLFDKITSLHFNDSESVLESILESLVDLERHGFDVSMPRDRVNQLLSIKGGNEAFLRESKVAENQIKELSDERRKLDGNISSIEKKISELQEELAAAKSKRENQDGEISRLQTRVDSMNFDLNNAHSRFEEVASGPWKLP
ncbi:DUF724 domain-containing protein 7-like [Euphorbia lathyris]|uniref:DUF724 domain-containing protein 7-like n=1 Tax=Euphorbia lathyris TaxID=212925 RepID=UPI003313CB66